MFGFRSHEVARSSPCPPKTSKRFTKHIRNKSSTFTDGVSNTLKRASRRISSNKHAIPAELCPSCVEYVIDRSEVPVHDVSLITSLSLAFDGVCPHQELHIAEILGMMGGLYHLELLDVRITPYFYAVLTEKAQFRLEYFACESPLFDSLLRFLSTQRHLLEFTYLARSLETQAISHPCGEEVLHTIQTLSTTAPLLLSPQLDPTSLQHLEYIGGDQSLREEARAIEKIYRLGPQLQSLRFMWGAGKTETFLDVTKFFCIAANTSSIKYIHLSDVSKNVFEQFVATGLRYKAWKKLHTFVWVPNPPHENDLDEPESPASPPSFFSPHLNDLLGMVKADHHFRPRRQSTASSWHSTTSTVSSRSAYSYLTTSTSSRRTRASSISDITRVDLSFRVHSIGRDMMATFPSLRRLALWNWNRMGYDLLTKTAAGGLVWTYHAEIDEDEWSSV